jgi:putative membrane protein
VAGLAISQLLPPFPHVPWGRSVIATPLILLGAVLSALSFFEWKRNQRALRRGVGMPRTHLPLVLAWAVGIIALVAVGVDLYSKTAVH